MLKRHIASNPAKCESDNATEENVSHKVNQDKTPEIIEISAKNRDGIDRLETVLKDMFLKEIFHLIMKSILRMSVRRRRLKKHTIRFERLWRVSETVCRRIFIPSI